MLGKIAIVGANGFVGRHLLDYASRTGLEVVGVVRSDTAAEVVRRLGGTPVRVSDLGSESTRALVPVLRGCRGLVHTASVSTGPNALDRTEPAGLRNVIEACREASVPALVFFSGLGMAHYGMNRHCTNPYFLAKMAGELALFRSGLRVTVLRPSYIFGPGDEFLTPLLRRLRVESALEIPGEGEYRLQPVSVRDAARAALGALGRDSESPRVVDLVGPEVLSYRDLIARVCVFLGREVVIRGRPIAEAEAMARESGYQGLRAHDLACLLCDEIGDSAPVQSLTGGELETLDAMISWSAAESLETQDVGP